MCLARVTKYKKEKNELLWCTWVRKQLHHKNPVKDGIMNAATALLSCHGI